MSVVASALLFVLTVFFYSVASDKPFATALRGSCLETSLEEQETRFNGVSIAYLTINPSVESKEPADKRTLYIFASSITKLTVNEPCRVVVRGSSIGCIVLRKGASLDVNNSSVVSLVRQR
jgi:hypothetical protein